MLYAGIDIHKRVFQAVVLDPDSGELAECRFEPSRERLDRWMGEWDGKLAAVAIEATTGWRWVARELERRGFEVHLVDPGRASALRGRRRQPKTDRLDARWLAVVLARQLPAEIQSLRDRTRLRKALVDNRTGWAQRLHAHEGWPCARRHLLTSEGRRWVLALQLDPGLQAQVEVMVTVITALDQQLQTVESELRRFARADRRCQTLETIFGVGPILACHLLAEIGDVHRFRRSRQVVRASGLDPAVLESADSKRRGRLAKQGSHHLRWAVVEAATPQQPANEPRPRPLHEHRCTLWPWPRPAHRRAQDRPPRLPPTRNRRSSSLNSTSCERSRPTRAETTCDVLPTHLADGQPSRPVGE
jgi:transposase